MFLSLANMLKKILHHCCNMWRHKNGGFIAKHMCLKDFKGIHGYSNGIVCEITCISGAGENC